MSDWRDVRRDDEERIRALQIDLEEAGVLPPPPRTVVQSLGPVLMAIASVLLGTGLGLTAIVAGWFSVLYLL